MHPLPELPVGVTHLRCILQRLVESDAVVAAAADAVALRLLGLVAAGIAATDAGVEPLYGEATGLLLGGGSGPCCCETATPPSPTRS
jgi:hypothetical protein